MDNNVEQNNVELITCTALKSELCGVIVSHTEHEILTKFTPTKQMICDEDNLIHSGFIFNAANYAAMCLVNQPFCVTIGSEVEFLAPLEFEQEMNFVGIIKQSNNKKYEIRVIGNLLDIKIFEAIFHIAIFDKQLFKLNFKD